MLCYTYVLCTGDLFMSCDSGAGAECDGDVAEEAEASVQLSLKQQLNLAIQRSMSDEVQPTVSPNIVKSTTAAVRTEFTIFQTTGVRGRCLQLAVVSSAGIRRGRASVFCSWIIVHKNSF